MESHKGGKDNRNSITGFQYRERVGDSGTTHDEGEHRPTQSPLRGRPVLSIRRYGVPSTTDPSVRSVFLVFSIPTLPSLPQNHS